MYSLQSPCKAPIERGFAINSNSKAPLYRNFTRASPQWGPSLWEHCYILGNNMSPEAFALVFVQHLLTDKILSRPSTSVPSERLFSAAGCTVTKDRERLHQDTMDELLFLLTY